MNLTTPAHKLYVARNEADENGATGAPAVFVLETESDFAQMPTATLDLQRRDLFNPNDLNTSANLVQNGVAFSFSGGSAANKTFTYDIYTWGNENSPARLQVSGAGVIGTQQVVKFPHNGVTATGRFWVDTITITYQNTLKEAKSTDTTGNNTISELWFDITGLRYIFIQISSADGSTGTEAGDIAVYYRYF